MPPYSTQAGIVLEDLGSKNGIHRNGTLVEGQVVLQDGIWCRSGLSAIYI
jgi:pSer/pThr/pTyr-binding forkhead associated (FHA) protein